MPNAPVRAAATGLPAESQNPSRRLFLAAGPAAAVFTSLTAAVGSSSASEIDPVFAAIKAAERAQKAANEAIHRLGQLEERHRDVAFYKPKARVRTNYWLGEAGELESTEVEYAYSIPEIRRFFFREPNGPEKTAKCIAAFEADAERTHAEQVRLGLVAAEEAADRASNALAEAEERALRTMPTTPRGAAALAAYATEVYADEQGPDMPIVETLRNLGAMLARFSGEV